MVSQLASELFECVEVEGASGRAVVHPEHALALCVGHFPGDPFLPGASLLELMAALAERVAAPACVRGIARCTFARRVRPDTEIVVTARAEGSVVEARLEAGGEPAAHAILKLS